MGYGHRFFLFPNDGSMRRISMRFFEAVYASEILLPEYAGQRIRTAHVILELENRRPVNILMIDGTYWHFDDKGDIRKAREEMMIEAMNALASFTNPDAPKKKRDTRGEKIVMFPRQKMRQTARERYYWKPTPKDITRIVNAIWKLGAKPKG